MTNFPYGKAPFWILVLSVITGIMLLVVSGKSNNDSYDLVFVTFARSHLEGYQQATKEFEKEHGVRIHIQLVSDRAVKDRLQSALMTDAEVPDLVETLADSMGYFTQGPVEDIGFMDLTDLLKQEQVNDVTLYDRFVESRFSRLSRNGRIYALPHDVHPLMLCYRRDIVEDELGIDINQIETWDDFTRIGRQVTKDLDGDGNPDRFMIDLDKAGGDFIIPLLQQRDEGLFDVDGNLTLDTEGVVDTIVWYIRQCYGLNRIAFSAGWGQTLAKTISDGLVLFYYCPDWRSKQFEMDVPQLEGKLALMPLPAWKPGGRRVSTWGGTGLAITKACKNKELAWAYAKKLYLKREDLADRFMASYILPPVKDAWELPIFQTPIPLYSNQSIGQLYAALAPDIPPNYASPYYELARSKLNEAFMNAAQYYQDQGESGLLVYTKSELQRVSGYVEKVMSHNVFYADAMYNGPNGKTSGMTTE